MEKEVIINLTDVSKSFDGEIVLDHINLKIHDKEFVTLLGPSGCGKTTVGNLLLGIIAPDEGEIFVNGMHISPYEQGNIFNRDPLRVRKLLMHKKEIMRLLGTTKQDGLTLIPLSVYFKKGRAKVQVGLCKGKKLYDKRDDAAKKSAKREIERAVKERF